MSGLLYGGIYFYEYMVDRDITNTEAALKKQREEFKPAEIAEYKRFDDRLKVAETILNNHIALSEILGLLNQITLPTVRYTSFDFSKTKTPATETEVNGEVVKKPATENLTILLNGDAGSFEDVASQAAQFEKNTFIKHSTFSKFKLNDSGSVSFTIEAEINPTLINYLAVLERTSTQSVENVVPEAEVDAGAPAVEDQGELPRDVNEDTQ